MATLRLKLIWCNDTTESGEDEIYFVVAGRRSDDSLVELRIPPDQNWDINDNGPDEKRKVENVDLWIGDLLHQQSVELTVVLLESDRSSIQQSRALAHELAVLTQTGGDIGASGNIHDLADKFLYDDVDSDDYIGAVSVRMTNDQGVIKDQWQARGDTVEVEKRQFRMHESSADYMLWFEIFP